MSIISSFREPCNNISRGKNSPVASQAESPACQICATVAVGTRDIVLVQFPTLRSFIISHFVESPAYNATSEKTRRTRTETAKSKWMLVCRQPATPPSFPSDSLSLTKSRPCKNRKIKCGEEHPHCVKYITPLPHLLAFIFLVSPDKTILCLFISTRLYCN